MTRSESREVADTRFDTRHPYKPATSRAPPLGIAVAMPSLMTSPSISRRSIILVALTLVGACSHANRDLPDTSLSTSYRDDSSDVLPGETTQETPESPPAETPTTPTFVAGPGGVPLPSDNTQRTDMVPGGGKMFMFEIPRSREVVSEELRANLSADGWTIDAEEVSPRHNALRLKVSKAGTTVDVRVAGDEANAGIIITLK